MVKKPKYLNCYPLTHEKIDEYVRGFEAMGFPQCMGAIDGCHIEVSPPKALCVDYYNYKGWHSTNILALVDYRYRFMYINVGAPGRCNDSQIFESTSLRKYHEENGIFRQDSRNINGSDIRVVIIGDSAFKLSKFLMKPFPFGLEKTEKERQFNLVHSKCRRVVANAFGHLKARFRRLGKGLENHIDNVNIIIKACCVLHNFLNEENDAISQLWLRELAENETREQPNFQTVIGDNNISGNEIRCSIAEFLCK